MAGYSGTPLVRKLGIRAGDRVALVAAPPGAEALLVDLPDGVALLRQARAPLDVVLLFVTERAVLARRLEELARRLVPAGMLWVCWPKRSSALGRTTDMTEDVVRGICLPLGLVDTKVCAIDETWSGLRLVWRKELRGALGG